MRRAEVWRHVHHEGLGAFAGALGGWDIGYREVPLDGVDRDAALAADLLIVLGGPCGAYEGADFPYLDAGVDALATRVAAGGAVLGMCLGAQLLARALGADVYAGPVQEIGWAGVELADAAGPLAALAGMPLLHWHGDTFDLPPGCKRLASTSSFANQAFARGPRVLGLQFHPEVDGSNIEHWLIGQAGALTAAGTSVAEVRAGAAAHGAAAGAAGRAMFTAWLAAAGLA